MTNPTIFFADRGMGKTTWLMDRIAHSLRQGCHVAVVTPTATFNQHLLHEVMNDVMMTATLDGPQGYADFYCEKDFENSRGGQYDHIYFDNADLFHDEPAMLAHLYHPGVDVTMTATPCPTHIRKRYTPCLMNSRPSTR